MTPRYWVPGLSPAEGSVKPPRGEPLYHSYSRPPLLLARIGRDAQVRLHCLVALGELLLDNFRILQRRYDDNVLALLPVGRRRHLVLVGQLQRVDRAQDFL